MILNCKQTRDNSINYVKEYIEKLSHNSNVTIPCLALVRVGQDPASIKYVNSKIKACTEVGMLSQLHELSEDITQEELINKINSLNSDNTVTAILVQLPLPKHLNEDIIVNTIKPEKDVDCLTSINIGKLFSNESIISPCTPTGIVKVLKANNIDLIGKDVLIINRSLLVGKPLVELLQREDSTIQLAHRKTNYLNEKIYNSDIVITAVGKEGFIKYDFLKDLNKSLISLNRHLYIVDVSININSKQKLCGDVECNCKDDLFMLESLSNIHVTPVPGGIGLTTVSSLLENTITLYKNL